MACIPQTHHSSTKSWGGFELTYKQLINDTSQMRELWWVQKFWREIQIRVPISSTSGKHTNIYIFFKNNDLNNSTFWLVLVFLRPFKPRKKIADFRPISHKIAQNGIQACFLNRQSLEMFQGKYYMCMYCVGFCNFWPRHNFDFWTCQCTAKTSVQTNLGFLEFS